MKKLSPYYEFMNPFFESGNDEAIQKAKQEYRRMYKAKWRKEKRKESKEVTIIFEFDELKEVSKEAKKHQMSFSKFVKMSTLSYMNKCYLVPNDKEVKKIVQLLTMTQLLIEDMIENNTLERMLGIELQQELFSLEREVRIALINPMTLEQTIQRAIENNSTSAKRLIEFLKNLEI